METLTTSASKIIFDKYRHRCYFSSRELYVHRPQLSFLRSKKHVNGRFLELFSLKEKAVWFISCIEADSQVFCSSLFHIILYEKFVFLFSSVIIFQNPLSRIDSLLFLQKIVLQIERKF